MIRQIEEKVVNRLRQVTSAIRQDGANQVSIITNTAERTAAVEFAKAAAMRPQIVGAALNRISADPEIEAALFEVLETQNRIDGRGTHLAGAARQRSDDAVARGVVPKPPDAADISLNSRGATSAPRYYNMFPHPGRQRQGIVLSPIVR